MKEIKKTLLGFVCLMSLFLACAEAKTIAAQLAWTLTMLSICFISGIILVKKYMTKEELEEEV